MLSVCRLPRVCAHDEKLNPAVYRYAGQAKNMYYFLGCAEKDQPSTKDALFAPPTPPPLLLQQPVVETLAASNAVAM